MYVEIMPDDNNEQRTKLKFPVKLGNPQQNVPCLLINLYGDALTSLFYGFLSTNGTLKIVI